MGRAKAAIVGSGNIGTDLLMKLLRSPHLDVAYMMGIDPASDGLAKARSCGVETSTGGVDWLLARAEPPTVVFEATSARVHARHAPRYSEAGIQVVDLTPAMVGPLVCPVVNLDEHLTAPNVNMITCGGQATVPIVRAVAREVPVAYAEIVSSAASRSAGPGTRANIDEFTATTAHAVERVGGAAKGKAIIILNPAEPPVLMRNTVFCAIPEDAETERVTTSIARMVDEVREYVPGYTLKMEPQYDPPRASWHGMARVAVFVEVRGGGDYLPEYAGNLDIMTAAAVRVGERMVSTTGVAR